MNSVTHPSNVVRGGYFRLQAVKWRPSLFSVKWCQTTKEGNGEGNKIKLTEIVRIPY